MFLVSFEAAVEYHSEAMLNSTYVRRIPTDRVDIVAKFFCNNDEAELFQQLFENEITINELKNLLFHLKMLRAR